jgi:hypothetical protein
MTAIEYYNTETNQLQIYIDVCVCVCIHISVHIYALEGMSAIFSFSLSNLQQYPLFMTLGLIMKLKPVLLRSETK